MTSYKEKIFKLIVLTEEYYIESFNDLVTIFETKIGLKKLKCDDPNRYNDEMYQLYRTVYANMCFYDRLSLIMDVCGIGYIFDKNINCDEQSNTILNVTPDKYIKQQIDNIRSVLNDNLLKEILNETL